MSNQLCLFVVHTPFQAFMAQCIRQSSDEYARTDNWLVMDMPRPTCDFFREDMWDRIIHFDPPIGTRPFRDRQRLSHELVRTLKLKLGEYSEVNLLASNLDYSISNVLYGILKRSMSVGFHFYSLPEGLANLVPTRWTLDKALRNLARVMYGLVLRLPFYSIGADITGMEWAERIYTLLPEALPKHLRTKAMQLKFENNSIKTQQPEESILVLGQDYEKFIPTRIYRRMLKKLIIYASSLNDVGTRYYKPHHSEAPWVREEFIRAGFEVITENCPAEVLFFRRSFRYLVSFSSSALLHVKLLMGEQVEVTAFGLSAIRWSPGTSAKRLEEIEKLFRSNGIAIVDVDL